MNLRVLRIGLAVLATMSIAMPAFADRDGRHHGRDEWHHERHERVEHEWHEHDRRPYSAYYDDDGYPGYGYVYVPPPVVYAPPPPPVVALPSLNFVIPLHFH